MHRTARTTAGFTIVELLVVIAIIAMLIGLLLPAVQSAREAGRRATCINNQKNIALACMRHDDTKGYLPGWRNLVGSSTTSWTVPILPFLERNDVYTGWVAGTPAAPYLALYTCPSSPADSTTVPTLAYAGNCGSASNAPPNASGLLGRRFDGVMVDNLATGTMAFKSTLDMVSEADGSTMTLLVSEKCSSGTTAFAQGTWNVIPGTSGTFAFEGTATAVPGFGVVGTAPGKVINNTTLGPPGLASQPSSNHPGGAVTAFCDGHVGFLKDSLLGVVYAQLLSPDHAKSANPWTAKYPLSEGDFQ